MDRESAERAVDAIIADISDRRGIGHEWFQIDEDIQREIREEWISLVMSVEVGGE